MGYIRMGYIRMGYIRMGYIHTGCIHMPFRGPWQPASGLFCARRAWLGASG